MPNGSVAQVFCRTRIFAGLFGNLLRLRLHLIGSLAQFLEQACVLDGDCHLVGEYRS
jgi:hypothetical protein